MPISALYMEVHGIMPISALYMEVHGIMPISTDNHLLLICPTNPSIFVQKSRFLMTNTCRY